MSVERRICLKMRQCGKTEAQRAYLDWYQKQRIQNMNNYLTEFSAVIPANDPIEAATKLRDLIKSGSITIATARGDQDGDTLMEVDIAEGTIIPIESEE